MLILMGSRQPRWWCRCDCGQESPVRRSDLLSGGSQSCLECSYGFIKNGVRIRKDITGYRFGQLTAIKPSHLVQPPQGQKRKVYWFCVCLCGRITVKSGGDLKVKYGVRTCGCLGPGNYTHGGSELLPKTKAKRCIDNFIRTHPVPADDICYFTTPSKKPTVGSTILIRGKQWQY